MAASLEHPLCIVGDVHLARDRRTEVGEALARLVAEHAESEIVLNGDSFDLSIDPPGSDPAASIRAILDAHAAARDAIRAHVAAGLPVTFVVGNHDAALAEPTVTHALEEALGPVNVAPWLLRRGPVHVEHGHVYDPDNAPIHPLAPWTLETEPLGVALTRRFVAPARAFDFAHSDETTPLAGFLRTFSLYGLRAPGVVFRYYATAAALTLEAQARKGLVDASREGARRVAELAGSSGIEEEVLHELAHGRPRPTHERAASAFTRLYLDRSLATLMLGLGLGALAFGGAAPVGVAAVSAAYLGLSIARGVNRYGGRLEKQLEGAARRVRALTGASTVIFGHTHRAWDSEGYLNAGSFAYPDSRGRGFVRVAPSGAAERRFEPI